MTRATAWFVVALLGPFWLLPQAFDYFADFGTELSSLTAFVKRVSDLLRQYIYLAAPILVCAYVAYEVLAVFLAEGRARMVRRIYWVGLILLVVIVVLSLAIPFASITRDLTTN